MKGILQTNRQLLPVIQKYGCLYMCLYEASGAEWSYRELNTNWDCLIKKGAISGDLNKDGDTDDEGEACIIDHDAVCKSFDLAVKYRGYHAPPYTDVSSAEIIIGAYRWKFTHFVLLNKNKWIIYDPLGSSLSVKNGRLVSLRLYDKIKAV